MFISENEVDLFADGKTCFAVNICKPAVFISFPKRQAFLLKSNLNVFRDLSSSGIDLRVDAIGLLNKKETSRFVKGTIWNGRKLHKLLPFNYNMWLKGSVEWTMEVPELSRRALISLIYLQTLNYSLTFVSHNMVGTFFGKFI